MQDLHDLDLILRSQVPIVIIESREESKVLDLCRRLCLRHNMPLFQWTVTTGLKRTDLDMPAQYHNAEPKEMLYQIRQSKHKGVYILLDFHPYLDDPLYVRLLKDIALSHGEASHTLVLVSHSLSLPEELEHLCARFKLKIPDQQNIRQVIIEELKRWQSGSGQKVHIEQDAIYKLANNLQGMTISDVRRMARNAIVDDNALTRSDIPRVNRAKYDLLARESVLSFEYETARFSDVGGLRQLKNWLEIRQHTFIEPESAKGLDIPKGILLLGVQGCGKSMAAKAVAGAWHIPLLSLDFGAIYNKFHGETEKNLRGSLATAEAMAPCVLWIDEIEKGLGIQQHDGGTSRRVLGTLLTWMAENDKQVFIVATANDIESLPPELMRKGRLDEIFFVDLPAGDIRQEIIAIHLAKREQEPEKFNLELLAHSSEGFSGAELEQMVVAGLYSAYAQNSDLGTQHLFDEIKRTKPLSVVMQEKISQLRQWARERTVLAD